MNRNRPPPAFASGAPTSGAWEEGRPESENLRQGEFKSPWTGQVYDRWAPIGLKQKGTDRQGGLGRSRAYETPMQRKIQKALEPGEKAVAEWEQYYPGLAPPHLMPTPRAKKEFPRHATCAGGFPDIFKQLLVQTVVDLKVKKSEKPLWYMELCAGEGEYSTRRLRKTLDEPLPQAVQCPTAEDFYEVLSKQDLTYMPMEVRNWFETVKELNTADQSFEVKRPGRQDDEEDEGVVKAVVKEEEGQLQWLPSTALCALKLLRKQDPVTLLEDKKIAFAALFNFVRNFSHKFEAHIELKLDDGFMTTNRWFITGKSDRPSTHGKNNDKRGLIFADCDFARGGEAHRLMQLMVRMRKHWMAATVIVTYPLSPNFEPRARKLLRNIIEEDPKLDLLQVEMYVDTPDYDEEWEDETRAKWYGCGALISTPPHTTAERVRAALSVMCEELSSREGGTPMRVTVEALK